MLTPYSCKGSTRKTGTRVLRHCNSAASSCPARPPPAGAARPTAPTLFRAVVVGLAQRAAAKLVHRKCATVQRGAAAAVERELALQLLPLAPERSARRAPSARRRTVAACHRCAAAGLAAGGRGRGGGGGRRRCGEGGAGDGQLEEAQACGAEVVEAAEEVERLVVDAQQVAMQRRRRSAAKGNLQEGADELRYAAASQQGVVGSVCGSADSCR
jgi:hypothetical protein